MADYLPRVDSLWSTTTWITAFSNLTAFAGNPPMSADDVYADGKTITIDTNIHVATLRTTTAPRTGGVAGGGFRATNNTSLTANILAGTSTCLTFASAAPNFFTLVGNISSSSTAGAFNNTGTGTATIIGNVEQPSILSLGMTNNGTANITGIIRGRTVAGVPSVNGITNSGIVNVIGTVFNRVVNNSTLNFVGSAIGGGGSMSSVGINNTGTLNMTGNCYGNITDTFSNCHGINNSGILNMIGEAHGSITNSDGYGIGNTGTLRLTGAAIGRGAVGGWGIGNTGLNSTVTVVGSAICFVGNRSHGIGNTSTGTVTVSGFVYGILGSQTGDAVYGAENSGGGTINATNVVGRTGSAINNSSSGTINADIVLGSINGSAGSGILNSSNGVINANIIQGSTATGGTGVGVLNSSTGRVNNANIAQGSITVAINNTSSGTVYIKRVVGAPGGPTNPTGGTAAGLSNSQNGLAYAEEIQFGAQGASPVSGPVFLVNRSNTVLVMEGPPPTFTETTLFGNLNVPNLFPPVSSVRSGITFGNGDFTGTMVVPPKDAVQIGVPVDNTVGTFVLSPESFWTFKRSNSAINDPTTIGYRIKNLATIPSVGSLIGSFNVATISGYSI